MKKVVQLKTLIVQILTELMLIINLGMEVVRLQSVLMATLILKENLRN